MNTEEKNKLRVRAARAVIKAHDAYIEAKNLADILQVDCRNLQHIYYIDGRGRACPLLINGKEVAE